MGCANSGTVSDPVKREFERPVDRQEFPAGALKILDSYFSSEPSIRYFEESDGDSRSFEAKVDLGEDQFSIEFNTYGELEDIEKLLLFDDLSALQKQTITDYFKSAYTSYQIIRTQLQYTSDVLEDVQLLPVIRNNDLDDVITKIEIEVEAQNTRELGFFEFLFEDDGTLIQRRRIFKRSIDNIW